MAVQWQPPEKRKKVQRILWRFPAKSSKCDRAAKSIWAVTDKEDRALIHLLLPQPDYGPLTGRERLQPQALPTQRWYYHACVGLQAHYVCALTKVDGHPDVTYLQHYFKESDAIRVEALPDPTDFDQRMGEVKTLW